MKLSDEDLVVLLNSFKKTLAPRANGLSREVEFEIVQSGKDPEVVLREILSRKDLSLYFRLVRRNLQRELNEARTKAEVRLQELNAPLMTREEVCHAWFDIYQPHGCQPDSFRTKVARQSDQLFKYLDFFGYNTGTGQGALSLRLSRENSPWDPSVIIEELKFVLPYIKENKDGEKYIGVTAPDCSESGIIHLIFKGDRADVSKTTYGRTRGILESSIEEVVQVLLGEAEQLLQKDRED